MRAQCPVLFPILLKQLLVKIPGTALTRALEDADATVRAGAACLMPAFMALSTRSQAKVVSAAFSALDTLKGETHVSCPAAACISANLSHLAEQADVLWNMIGDPSKAVRLEAAKAVGSLIEMQALHAQPFNILALACLSAEYYCPGGCGPAHWQCFAGIEGDQFPKEDQQIDVLLGLQHVQSLASTLILREPEDDVQVRRSNCM